MIPSTFGHGCICLDHKNSNIIWKSLVIQHALVRFGVKKTASAEWRGAEPAYEMGVYCTIGGSMLNVNLCTNAMPLLCTNDHTSALSNDCVKHIA